MRAAHYSRSPDVLWRATTDRVVLRALHGGGLVSLTGSGTTLWALLARPIGFEDLVTAMASHYGVGVDVVRDSVAAALADLERVHLVVKDERETPRHVEVPEPRSPLEAAQ